MCSQLFAALYLAGSSVCAEALTFTVTNTNDSGAGSLRQAILDANANPGPDIIEFDIPIPEVGIAQVQGVTIRPSSPLPTITESLFINGWTQMGAIPNSDLLGNNAHIMVGIDGASAGTGAAGFRISNVPSTPGVEITGLAVFNFSASCIRADMSLVSVHGCNLGLDQEGQPGGCGGDGIWGVNSQLRIGGRTAADRTVLSYNNRHGVHFDGMSAGGSVEGCFVGTTAGGTAAAGNLQNGVHINEASNVTCGEAATGAFNVISGNCNCGGAITGFNAENNTFRNNFFGTDVTKTTPIPNKNGACVDEGVLTVFDSNTFAYNVFNGVETGAESQFTLIRLNSFFNNGLLAIDNLRDGVTLRNLPRIQAVAPAGNLIFGDFFGADPNQIFFVDVHISPNADASGFGEGKTPFASGSGTTDATGKGSWTASSPTLPPTGQPIYSALATAPFPAQNTFEFGHGFNRNASGTVFRLTLNCPETVAPGSQFSCATAIANDIMAARTAENVLAGFFIQDLGVDDVPTSDGILCMIEGNNVGCTAASVAPDAMVSFTVTGTAPATPGAITACADVEADLTPLTSICKDIEVAGVPACTLLCPADTTEPSDAMTCGTTVTFSPPTAVGDCGAVTCDPSSGSFFPLGMMTVACSSERGGGACSFTVTVVDVTPPNITCPDDITETVPAGQNEAIVNYADPTVSDNCDAEPTVMCSPVSGSIFPLGTTPVVCTASDDSVNVATCSFDVTVNQAAAVVCTLDPPTDSNDVGTDHTVTVTVTKDGEPLSGVTVSFNVTDGPNAGDASTGVTDGAGQASFTYTGDGGTGTDTIQASGTVGEQTFSCEATKEWLEVPPPNQPPVARCKDVAKEADETGFADVSPEEVDDGSFDPDGESVTLTLEPTGPFPVGDNSYTLFVTDPQGAFSTCGGTVTVTPQPMADLAVIKSSEPEPVIINESVVFTVTVTNRGPDTATNVRIIENTPANVAVGNVPDTCQSEPEGLVCSVGDLPPNGSAQLVLNGGGFTIGVDTNTATVVSDTFDPDSSNNSTSVVVTVVAPPMLFCDLSPVLATNVVRNFHTTTVTVSRDDMPLADEPVTFRITSGPNSAGFMPQTKTTDANGQASFQYFGGGTPGPDMLEVTGAGFSCTATKVWIVEGNEPPVARCRDVFKFVPAGETAQVTPDEVDDGSSDPDGTIVNRTLNPPGPFPIGTHTVELTVTDNNAATDTCSATITVQARPAILLCGVIPGVATNVVGTTHTFDVVVRGDGQPLAGVNVAAGVVQGPNAGFRDVKITDASGIARFSYDSDGRTGNDAIDVLAFIEGLSTQCFAFKVWALPRSCTIDPMSATNQAGSVHTFFVKVFQSGSPAPNAPVTFNVITGPNVGQTGSTTTDTAGEAQFQYRSNGETGPDTIMVTATVAGDTTTCFADKIWVSVTDAVEDLIDKVNGTGLNGGNKNSLTKKLAGARESLDRGKTKAATNKLRAFINEVEAMKRSGRLDATTADDLINDAQQIINQLEGGQSGARNNRRSSTASSRGSRPSPSRGTPAGSGS